MARAPEDDLDADGFNAIERGGDAKPLRPVVDSGASVKVQITKFGHGKVSTGEHVAMFGDVMAERNEIIAVSQSVADSLEARGFAEIYEEPEIEPEPVKRGPGRPRKVEEVAEAAE